MFRRRGALVEADEDSSVAILEHGSFCRISLSPCVVRLIDELEVRSSSGTCAALVLGYSTSAATLLEAIDPSCDRTACHMTSLGVGIAGAPEHTYTSTRSMST